MNDTYSLMVWEDDPTGPNKREPMSTEPMNASNIPSNSATPSDTESSDVRPRNVRRPDARPTDVRPWKGLAVLVTDAVANGATAIERVHLATSARPFDLLQQVPVVAAPTYVVRLVHDASVGMTYAAVRGITRIVGKAVGLALDAA